MYNSNTRAHAQKIEKRNLHGGLVSAKNLLNVAKRHHSLFSAICLALVLLAILTVVSHNRAPIVLAAVNKDFNQCRNDVPTNPVNFGKCTWTGGNLNSTQATYYEGMGSFQRIIYRGIASGTSHTITINYQFSNQNATKGHDFLISWAQAITLHQQATRVTPTLNQCANLNPAFTAICTQLTGASAFFVDVPLPDDPYNSAAGNGLVQTRINEFETIYGNRTLRLYSDCPFNGTPTFTISHLAPDTGDSDVQVIMTYVTRAPMGMESAPNCLAGGVSDNVMGQFAGHLAYSGVCVLCWGPNNGANGIKGSGWHIRNMEFDGSGGSVDNQIQIADFSPTAAELASFSAALTGDRQITVRWETATELNVLGFNLWRKRGKGGWKQLNAEVIDVQTPGSITGNAYEYIDSPLRRGKKYKYKLEVLRTDGTSGWSKRVKVQVPKE